MTARACVTAALLVVACGGDAPRTSVGAGGAGEGGSASAGTSGGAGAAGQAGTTAAGGAAGAPVSGAAGAAGSAGSGGAAVARADAGVADASTGTAADGGTPSPPALPNAVLWLDAARGVTADGSGRVSRWLDQSPAHNDGAQMNAANAPTLVTNVVRGHPVVRFEEARNTAIALADAPTLNFGSGDFAIVLVAANRTTFVGKGHGGGVAVIFAKKNTMTGNEVTFHFNWFNGEMADDTSKMHIGLGEAVPGGAITTTSGYNDGAFRVYSAVRNAGGLDVRIAGKVAGHGNPPKNADVSSPGQRALIGSAFGQSIEGDIAEYVVVKGMLAPRDLEALEAYLAAKYGL